MIDGKRKAAELLANSRAFCIVPWVHLHVPTSGPLMPCCEAKGGFGTAYGEDIEGAWNSPEMKAFRLKLLADEPDERCSKCHNIERQGAPSTRQRFNVDFGNYVGRVEATQSDGALATARPVSWDIRFSNICNFRCRSCWHGASSAWFEDAKALGTTVGETAYLRSVQDPQRFLEQMEPMLDEVEAIYFAGGEPLMMEGHYLIIEALLRRGLTDVRLYYTSNLSQLLYKNKSVIDLWARFGKVTVGASADGMGSRGEFIRKGLDWDRFLQNFLTVKRECPHVDLNLTMTISAFNLLHFPDFHRTMIEDGVTLPHQWWLYVLESAPYLSISQLPEDVKAKALDKLRSHEAWLRAWYDSRPDIVPGERESFKWMSVIHKFLAVEADPLQQAEFRRVNGELDRLRGEQTLEVFPELASLLRG